MTKPCSHDVSSMQAHRGTDGETIGLEAVYDHQADVYDAIRYESIEEWFFDLVEGRISIVCQICDGLMVVPEKPAD